MTPNLVEIKYKYPKVFVNKRTNTSLKETGLSKAKRK
jgi:hypothetical protein